MKEQDLQEIRELSHKISTPLTTILGYVRFMEMESPEKKEKLHPLSEKIKKEVLKASEYSKTINRIVHKYLPD